MIFIRGISLQDPVLRDQTLRTFGQEDFVAELDRFIDLSSLNQIGVRLKDRIDFFRSRNLLPIQDPAAGLIDDPVSQLAIVGDLLPKRLNG